MPISYGQYHTRSSILRGLLRNYIDDSYARLRTVREIEETALLTLSIPKLLHDKIATFLRNILHCQVSLEEIQIEGSNNILLNICLDTDRFHHANLTHLTTAFEDLALPKYLILDSDEIFKIMYPSDEDIVLETYDCGSKQVLENGYQIIKHLNELTETLGYEIVFHSNNSQRDQALLLMKLQSACTRHKVIFPKVRAMIACDQSDSAQQALETALCITKEDRRLHIVFEESTLNLSAATKAGYQGRLLGNTKESSFDTLLEQILVHAKQKRALVTTSITDAPVCVAQRTSASYRFFPDVEDDKIHSTRTIPQANSASGDKRAVTSATSASLNIVPSEDEEPSKSSLTVAQQTEIQTMISGFRKKVESRWYRDKERRRQKAVALEDLLQHCTTMDVVDAVAQVNAKFPNISKGTLCALLRRLSNETAQHGGALTTSRDFV